MKMNLLLVLMMLFGVNLSGEAGKKSDNTTLTDERDKQVYPVLKIKNKFWMGKNLNFAEEKDSSCYSYFGNPCDTYGRLYSWNSALNACPAGWHLPSDEEWTDLEIFYGLKKADAEKMDDRGTHGKKMTAKDKGSFNVRWGGWRMHEGGYTGLNVVSFYWASTQTGYNNSHAFARRFVDRKETVGRLKVQKSAGFSVRCVKD